MDLLFLPRIQGYGMHDRIRMHGGREPSQFGLRTLFVAVGLSAVAAALARNWGMTGTILFIVVGWIALAMRVSYLNSSGRLSPEQSRPVLELVLWLGVPAIALPVAYLNGVFDPPRISWRQRCPNQLAQIGKALLAYQRDHGNLPPAYVTDASGKPMHSWRVLLLPFLDQKGLYRAYNFDEPWDGPNNRKLHLIMHTFVCPSARSTNPRDNLNTNYVAVVGPGTAWPGPTGVKPSDFKDGRANCILLVEIADSDIHWMEPRDLTLADIQSRRRINIEGEGGMSSYHAGGVNVLFADGTTLFLSQDTPIQAILDLLTIAGGEKTTAADVPEGG